MAARKTLCRCYLMWLFFGWAGGHRFYLGFTSSGCLYLFSVGLCGLGWLADLFLMPQLLDEYNALEAAKLPLGAGLVLTQPDVIVAVRD